MVKLICLLLIAVAIMPARFQVVQEPFNKCCVVDLASLRMAYNYTKNWLRFRWRYRTTSRNR